MMKILTILGTRPQFIKAGAFSNYLKNNAKVQEVIADSGQHYDLAMSSNFFEEMQIPKPKYNFFAGGLSHAKMTAKILEKSEEVLLNEKPDFLLVYGDTNTTIGASLAAAKLGIPIVHIESGLRSFRKNQPEEINRILTDKLSTFLFCPSNLAVSNLKREGLEDGKRGLFIQNVGDIMLESVLLFQDKLKPSKEILGLAENPFCLLTMHRQENVDDKNILSDILSVFSNFKENVIFPIHPRTKKRIDEFKIKLPSNIILIQPASYGDMLFLIKHSKFVITDSGGLQKEAYFLNKNTLILREETEWIELVDEGISLLAGTTKEDILNAYNKLYRNEKSFKANIYGDGTTCKQILEALQK